MIAESKTNKEIASTLNLSVYTVDAIAADRPPTRAIALTLGPARI